MKTAIIKIEGMTCGGCVQSVENALNSINGVMTTVVSLPDANAAVDYDEQRTSPQALAAAVEEAGFDAQL